MARGWPLRVNFCGAFTNNGLGEGNCIAMPSFIAHRMRWLNYPPLRHQGVPFGSECFWRGLNTGALALLSAAVPKNASKARRKIAAEAALTWHGHSGGVVAFLFAFAGRFAGKQTHGRQLPLVAFTDGLQWFRFRFLIGLFPSHN